MVKLAVLLIVLFSAGTFLAHAIEASRRLFEAVQMTVKSVVTKSLICSAVALATAADGPVTFETRSP